MADRDGYIILFHFNPPYKHARHCYDWVPLSNNPIKDRMVAHYMGKTRGPSLIRAAITSGSKLEVGKIMNGTFTDMSKLRTHGNAVRECRICRKQRKLTYQEEHLGEILQKSLEAGN